MPKLTIDELIRTMRECAGEDESVDLAADIVDTPFGDLGYDSLAVLETASRLGREFNVRLSDDLVFTVETPAQLIAVVNDRLADLIEPQKATTRVCTDHASMVVDPAD